jgi:hypothetical protein
MSSTTMGGTIISDANRLLFLRIALIAFGLTFTLIYPLGVVWPSGWAWGHGHSHYLMMIGVYGTLGVFLILASRNPDAHRSIIWFTVWSSVVHGTIMSVQSFNDAGERGHLLGDVPALFLVAISRIDAANRIGGKPLTTEAAKELAAGRRVVQTGGDYDPDAKDQRGYLPPFHN